MQLRRVLRIAPHLARAPELARCIRESPDWPTLAAGYLGLRSLRYPRAFRTRHGNRLVLERFEDLATAWLVFLRRDYPVDPAARLILDAGANIGTFSLFAAQVAPGARIVALEPFPETFARLQGHVARSPDAGRITCCPWALAGADEPRSMDAAPGASQFRGLRARGAAGPGPLVEAITLATLWQRQRLDRVDLLKLDIEGSEYEVIRAAPPELLRRIGAIALEYHPHGSKSELFARLRAAGFDLARDDPAPDPGYGLALFHLGRPEAAAVGPGPTAGGGGKPS